MRRRASRWATPFGQFVSRMGVGRLVSELHRLGEPVTNKAVYSWISGDGRPRMDTAMKLVRISEGALSLESIVSQRVSVADNGGVHGTTSPTGRARE